MTVRPLQPLRRSRRLSPGDTVAVVATSGPLESGRLSRGIAILQAWGLDVRVGEHALDRDPVFAHLAGSDTDRAHDFEDAWCDPQVRAVFVGRGGSGAARIIDLLHWPRIRAAGAKILVGFSDVTVLHEAVAAELGLATLFGPMPATIAFAGEQPHAATVEHLRRTLFDPATVRVLAAEEPRCVVPGSANGVVTGGTVSLVAASVGTAHCRPARGGIAVLEDVAEPAYRLDTHLTHLMRAGWFDGVRAVVLGSWTGCSDDAGDVVAARLRELEVPMFAGLAFGHCTPSLTVPLGVSAAVDAGAGTVTLDHPALA